MSEVMFGMCICVCAVRFYEACSAVTFYGPAKGGVKKTATTADNCAFFAQRLAI